MRFNRYRGSANPVLTRLQHIYIAELGHDVEYNEEEFPLPGALIAGKMGYACSRGNTGPVPHKGWCGVVNEDR